LTDRMIFTTVVLGVAASVIAAIIINKYFTDTNVPQTQPAQGMQVEYPGVTSPEAAPVAQNSPITEAAYNIGVGSRYSRGDNHIWNCAAFGSEANGTAADNDAMLPR
jgi:hypothetical protein